MSATLTPIPSPSGGPQAPAPYTDIDKQYIAGEWCSGSGETSLENKDPYTGKTLFTMRSANAGDVDRAYRSAEDAQHAWAALPPQARSAVLQTAATIFAARKDEAIGWIIRESGKTRIAAEIEHMLVHAGMLEAASYPSRIVGEILPSSIPGMETRVYRDPIGVVGIISPFNFPMQLANRSIAPAIGTGNAIVVKPASDTPVCGALFLAKIYEEAGLPKGVFNAVIGAGSEIGDSIIEHPVPRAISFTGSTPVGSHIGELAGKHVKRVALELGGNAPFLVLDDADLDIAVNAAVSGKFTHQGQICMAINRIVVDRKVYDEFVVRFTDKVRSLPVGDPSDPKTVIGPIINEKQLKSVLEKVERVKQSGARVILDGKANGNVLSPVILSDVKNANAQEEFFGPVAVIIPVENEEEAIRVANDTEYGLSSAVISKDVERAARVARRIDAGMTHINDTTVNDEPNTAFGGEKKSGLGRFGGEWAIREFTTDHWISVRSTPREYPF